MLTSRIGIQPPFNAMFHRQSPERTFSPITIEFESPEAHVPNVTTSLRPEDEMAVWEEIMKDPSLTNESQTANTK